jgi:hypothetical protein
MTRLVAVVAAVALTAVSGTAAAQTPPVIAELRVHGNHSTPDADVVTLSGLAVGQPATDEALAAAKAKIEASGRFASVAVRRLERSIDTPDDFMVMLLVEERAGVSPDDLTPSWPERVLAQRMWLPVLRYEEGYGVTYGLHAALDGAFGGQSRLSVPATWGGERRIGVEAERSFDGPFISRVVTGFDVKRTVHPAFERAEERVRAFGRLERRLVTGVTLGVEAGRDRVRFAGRRDDVDRALADVVVDTRLDPGFPRNAVWGRASLERLDVVTGVRRRTRADASAAIGIPFGSAVVLRGFHTTSNGALPAYEQTMIGGWMATRGYRRGYRIADNAAGASITLARPFGSPLASIRHGLRAFVDWAAVYDAGTKVGDATFDRGIGVGWFANLAAVNAFVDFGRSRDGRWRAHVRFGTGF